MYLGKNDFILFTGDSITDAGRKRPLGEGLWDGVGNGYVREVDNLRRYLQNYEMQMASGCA